MTESCCFQKCDRNPGKRFFYHCLPNILEQIVVLLLTPAFGSLWSQWGCNGSSPLSMMVSDAFWRTQGYDVTHSCLALFGFGWKWHNAYLLSIIGEFSLQPHRYVTFFGLMFFAHRELNLMILYQGQGSCCWSLLRIIILFLQSPDMCKVCTRLFSWLSGGGVSISAIVKCLEFKSIQECSFGFGQQNSVFFFFFPFFLLFSLYVGWLLSTPADLLLICWSVDFVGFHLYLQLICILNACSYCWLWRFYVSCDSLKLLSVW